MEERKSKPEAEGRELTGWGLERLVVRPSYQNQSFRQLEAVSMADQVIGI
jgi:hypothetical protein